MRFRLLVILLSAGVLFTACDDDDDTTTDPMTRTFTVTVTNDMTAGAYLASGVFNTPTTAGAPGPALPGDSYQFSFHAGPGSYLSFATMMVQSNDFFYAPAAGGMALYDAGGNAVTGDVTSSIMLWDAGTEVDQEPGSGADQAPRQSGPNTGAADADNTVRLAADNFNNLPAVSDVIRVTITHNPPYEFTVTLENVSNAMTLMTMDNGSVPVPLAPGVFVVHGMGAEPLFTVGQADRGEGLEGVAEDGAAADLGAALEANTMLSSPLAPGAFAVYTGNNPLFTSGQADFGDGLEAVAEDGDPAALATALAAKGNVQESGAFNTPVGAGSPGPLLPGGSYEFTFEASEGELLQFATMLVQTNDLFFAPGQNGIALFNNGTALSGNITAQISLWDAGTEVNEAPGIGSNQAPRQSGPNTGMDENGNVRPVNDGFSYPAVTDMITVTITPQ